MFKVGTVVKYLEKTEVCLVNLIAELSISDKIRVFHKFGDTVENPEIKFIQIGIQKVDVAPKGITVIVKFDRPLKEGSEIYRNG